MEKESVLLESVGRNIRRLRQYNNETATELAKAIGVSQSTVSDWERAKKLPRAGAVQRLADHFGVKISQILNSDMELAGVRVASAYEIYDLEGILSGSTRLAYGSRILASEEKMLIKRLCEAVLSESRD